MSTLFISSATFEGKGGAFGGTARKDIGELGDYHVCLGNLNLVKGTLTIKLV